METIVKRLDRSHMERGDFKEAAEILRVGGLVAFPTETVYGLGGNALDETAAAKIYAAKGRPSDNPLIVHIADLDALEELAEEVPEEARLLADRFWPGPLTIILKKSSLVPNGTTGGLPTVAIRMPSDPVARMLLQEAGLYIAAPSANASGRPSTTRAEHVYEDLAGKIEMILDGGSAALGLESTIVDLSVKPPLILRPGFVTLEDLQEVLPDAAYDHAILGRGQGENLVAKAPGMKYRHYAPKGSLQIYEGQEEAVIQAINSAAGQKTCEGARVAVLATEETKGRYCYGMVKSIGSRKDEEGIAANLFKILREFDEAHMEYIYSESFDTGHLGQAIMNRLLKAAGYQVVRT